MSHPHPAIEKTDPFVVIDGIECFVINDVDQMEPFLVTVVSDADLWMFASSAGSLTAGRVDADHAIFPYVTDDLIHRASGDVGPVTVLARTAEGKRELWRPFHREKTAGCRRSLAKSLLGDRLVFEEANPAWQMRIRATWAPSRTHGWVRTVDLIDEGDGSTVEILDGVLDVMPSGVDADLEQTRSNLVNAFKRSELMPGAGRLAVFNLESLITDRTEPGEALTATTTWSWGLDGAAVNLDSRAVRRFLCDSSAAQLPQLSPLIVGRPGAYLLHDTVTLGPGATTSWGIVLDTAMDHRRLALATQHAGSGYAGQEVLADIAAGSEKLQQFLSAADGFHQTGDRIADAHHLSNVLFNSMRGGVFPYEQRIPVADFAQFIEQRNRPVAARHREWLSQFAPQIELAQLQAEAEARQDPDLVRLVLEYLPLTFSRRHGDPSRPWNRFAIHVTDADGSEILRYEGNWRDIFQNWEALLHSFPAYFPNVVAKFVNASTLDGYNPYRISTDGIDWEVPDPHDPWANIGYWGDHQIVYLLRLLEGWDRFEPGAIERWLNDPAFVYADVPYRISDRSQMIDDPRNTISFLDGRAAWIADRETEIGSDGRLVGDTSGELLRAGLAEKLLVPALSKMSNFIPGAGIWMNTQRPEWNDANNALAGPGASMVTVFHLHSYLTFVRAKLDGGRIRLSPPVASWLAELSEVYRTHSTDVDDPVARRTIIGALGRVADEHTQRMLAGAQVDSVSVDAAEVLAFIDLALDALAASIRSSSRPSGLVDSYNLVSFPTPTTAEVTRLGPMLEGQVAALSCGLLDPTDALNLIDALYASEMYRADLDTFMLYPAPELPAFSDRNTVPDGLLADDVALSCPSVLVEDAHGQLHFRPSAFNAQAVGALLDQDDVSEAARAAVVDAYEATFNHASYTGRSGSMYGYEGLGSVYWHMVSKLLLATQKVYWSARDNDAEPHVVERLGRAYRQLRHGLGFTKTPEVFGAFPTDCYSHSPSHSGAQQPGMTGQVKEAVLTRLGELGVRVKHGLIKVEPGLLQPDEHFDGDGVARFSLCAVPMTVRLANAAHVEVVHADGTTSTQKGSALTRDQSEAVFARTGEIAEVHWRVLAN